MCSDYAPGSHTALKVALCIVPGQKNLVCGQLLMDCIGIGEDLSMKVQCVWRVCNAPTYYMTGRAATCAMGTPGRPMGGPIAWGSRPRGHVYSCVRKACATLERSPSVTIMVCMSCSPTMQELAGQPEAAAYRYTWCEWGGKSCMLGCALLQWCPLRRCRLNLTLMSCCH